MTRACLRDHGNRRTQLIHQNSDLVAFVWAPGAIVDGSFKNAAAGG